MMNKTATDKPKNRYSGEDPQGYVVKTTAGRVATLLDASGRPLLDKEKKQVKNHFTEYKLAAAAARMHGTAVGLHAQAVRA